jgi:hypothetical protein
VVVQCGQCLALALGEFADRCAVREREDHVQMDPDQAVGVLDGECGTDLGSPVPALGAVARVAEPAHQLIPGIRNALGGPARVRRLTAEPEPWQRGAHHMERVTSARAERNRIDQRLDDLVELDD